jgi:RNA polymerase sigma-70 factor (ECF subfamily)
VHVKDLFALSRGLRDNRRMSGLQQAFLKALATEHRATFEREARLAEALADLLARARAAWPSLSISDESFLPFLAERVPDGADLARLERLNVEDLYLACGCAAGSPKAVELFASRFFPVIKRAVAQLDVPAAWVEDIRQTVYDKLFLTDSERPAAIRHYQGSGDLATWVHVVAVRQTVDLIRKRNREQTMRELPEVIASDDNPELRFLKERFGSEFKAVFEDVVSRLSSKERNLLRYQLVASLTLEQIAGVYRVNRSTVVRWMQALRDKLLEQTRVGLSEKLHLTGGEFVSLMRLIQSQLQVSIKRLLG